MVKPFLFPFLFKLKIEYESEEETYGPAERLSRRIYYRDCSQLNGDLSKNPK